jgi:hypothetical protein
MISVYINKHTTKPSGELEFRLPRCAIVRLTSKVVPEMI